MVLQPVLACGFRLRMCSGQFALRLAQIEAVSYYSSKFRISDQAITSTERAVHFCHGSDVVRNMKGRRKQDVDRGSRLPVCPADTDGGGFPDLHAKCRICSNIS